MTKTSTPRRRVSEVVETGVEGLYGFLYRLLRTFWLVIRGRGAARELAADRHRAQTRFVYPFTYAAIGTFLLSVVAAVAGSQVADWLWFDDEISRGVVDRLSTVSLGAIAIGSIPAFIVMLALAGAITPTFSRRTGRSARALFLTCYAIGTQSALLFLAAVIVAFAQFLPEQPRMLAVGLGGFSIAALLLCLLLSFVVPVRFYHLSDSALESSWPRRMAQLGVYAMATILAFFALPWAAGAPNQLAEAVKPSSAVEITLASDVNIRGGSQIIVAVLLKNPGNRPFGAASADVVGELRYGPDPDASVALRLNFKATRIDEERGVAVDHTIVTPGGLAWRRLHFAIAASEQETVKALLLSDGRKCLQVAFGKGSDQVSTGCVYASFKIDQPPHLDQTRLEPNQTASSR